MVLNKKYEVPAPEFRNIEKNLEFSKSQFYDLNNHKNENEKIELKSQSFAQNNVPGWSFVKGVNV